jgi:hypothetical protein
MAPSAHADVQQPIALPDGVDAGRPLRHLLIRPVPEAVNCPSFQLLHGMPPWPDANRLAHESIREQTRQDGTGRDREAAKFLLRHTTGTNRCAARRAWRG